MKKLLVFLSFVFLSLVSAPKDSNAVCAPKIFDCNQILIETDCDLVTGCSWTDGTNGNLGKCTGANSIQCSTLSNEAMCKAAPCSWIIQADANNNAFVDTLCRALKIVTGSAGKAFAAFAIISVGIGFFTGKVSWGLMIGVTCGIAAMFGAPTIVAAIAGGQAMDCGS
ncbi:MAG: hypothetical protein K0R25_768 [Rickettsiaceae bacterium]|jgi:type IV secretory pathway VirB2 component (pilin)|nr:hypothetical protein [Rickettsiaceae bacterium]